MRAGTTQFRNDLRVMQIHGLPQRRSLPPPGRTTRRPSSADALAIALYLHVWLAVYLRRAWQWPWRLAWLGVPAFFVLSQLFTAAWRLGQMEPAAYLAVERAAVGDD